MFNLQKEWLVKAEEERVWLDKENLEMRSRIDKLTVEDAKMRDQVKMFTDYHKWDEDLIQTKTSEAKVLSEESWVFKQLYEETRN